MKSLTESILESAAWWVPFKELFQAHVKDIMKSTGDRFVDLSKPMKVSKIGSSKSKAFGVQYKNTSGVSCMYEFSIPPRSAAVGAYVLNQNDVVDKLVKDNASKLPKLTFDRIGNVLN